VPKLTLVLWLVYLATSLGLRIVIQLRTTGKSGFVLHRANSSRLQLFASALFVSSSLAGLASPGLALALPGHAIFGAWHLQPLAAALGGLLYACGLSLAIASQFTLGRSWRVGVDTSERTELITRGAFRIVRNPIFSALQLTTVGLALLCSTHLGWLACAAQFVALELQVRGVEEPYLARVHGDAYRDYTARVGRFVPGLGLSPERRIRDRIARRSGS
jgi:protein-S-isoprenylcysteine O-methyltransferase Ste14